MTYDYTAIGGTGCWQLLQILFAHTAVGVPLPRRIWVIDSDDGVDPGRLPGLLRQAAKMLNVKITWINPTAPLGMEKPDSLARALRWDRSVLHAALTVDELATNIEKGFYADPRLAAASVSYLSGLAYEEYGEYEMLRSSYLHPTADDEAGIPHVLGGSLVGGMGAGLIGLLLNLMRRGGAQSWRRDLLVLAFLPWFDPQRDSTDEDIVPWDRLCSNASQGVRSLQRATERVSRSALLVGDGQKVPRTSVLVMGVPKDVAHATAPLDPSSIKRDKPLHPLLYTVAVSLPDLLAQDNPQLQSGERCIFGGIGVHMVEGPGATWRTGLPRAVIAESDRAARQTRVVRTADLFTAAALETLAGLPWTAAMRRMSLPVRGFGRVMGSVVRACAADRASRGRGAELLEALTEAWTTRATELREGATGSGDRSVLQARDAGALLKLIDRLMTTSAERIELIRVAENACSGGDLTTATVEIARRVERALRQQTSRDAERQVGESTVAPAVGPRHLLLDDSVALPAPSAGSGSCASPFGPLEQWATTAASIGDHYAPLGADEVDSRSYATVLGVGHVLASLVPTQQLTHHTAPRLREDPAWAPALERVLLLWRAAVRGFVRIRPIEHPEELRHLWLTEDIDWDFGGTILLVHYGDHVVGHVSTKLGFVPHVEIVDTRPRRQAALQTALQTQMDTLAASLVATRSIDLAILRDFASAVYPTGGGQRVEAHPPWARLLRAGAPGTPTGASLKGVAVPLQTPDGVSAVPLPYAADSEIVAMFEVVNRTPNRKLVPHPAPDSAELLFLPFADERHVIAELAGGRISRLNRDVLERACAAVAKPRDTDAPRLHDWRW